jgi:zinc transport system substrate-binding protein
MKFLFSVFFAFAFLFTSMGCAPKSEDSASGVKIWVSLLPQQAIVAAVAGEHGTVQVMVRPGQSPETYSPSAPQMAALAKADLYFGIGIPLERVIQAKIESSMPQLIFVQTADAKPTDHDDHVAHEEHLDHDEVVAGEVHAHATHAEHTHEGKDPHVWMDPIWMLGFVEQVRDALIELDPQAATEYRANAEAVSQHLRELDATLRAQLQPFSGRSFYINHPSLGHFAARYGLVQRSIEHAGSAPAAKEIAGLIQAAKQEQVSAIFTQPEFGQSSADVLAKALDVEVIEVDVLGADYFSNMLDIGQRLEDSFSHE